MIFDDYNIDEQYQAMRKALLEVEKDLYTFLGKTRNNRAAMRARANLKKIENIIKPLRQSIQKQRQDNKSEY